MKNTLSLIAVFCLIFGATLGCKNNALSKLNEPKSECADDLPKLDSAAEYAERGVKETNEGNYECGFDDCQKALDLDPKNVDALLCRGYIYKQRSEITLAEKDFNEAVRLAPDNALTFSQRGQFYKQIKEFDKALADMNRVIEMMPADFYYERRAQIYAELKDYENAVRDYTEAIRQKPETDYYYNERAEVYRALGKKDLAEADETKYTEIQAQRELKSGTAIKDYQTIVNDLAVSLPKPVYPPTSQTVKENSTIKVGITVDANGNVVSAQTISGHPFLQTAAEKAAQQAKFKPLAMGGVLVYDFVAR